MAEDAVICIGCGLPYLEDALHDGASDASALGESCECPPPSHVAEAIACPTCGGALKVGARACPFCSCTLATARCSACAAWNLAASHFCRSCGDSLRDGDLSERPGHGPCPRCHEPMSPRLYADLDLDECDACGGVFVEAPMMDRIFARERSAPLHLALPKREAPRETQVRYLKCPICETLMNRKIFGRVSGVVVDVCKPHGVWFDAGELQAVIDFVQRGGLAETRRREAEDKARLDAEKRALAQISWTPQGGADSTRSPAFQLLQDLAIAWLRR
ncbi:MAG: zf-TFIIB domain-containing protein [Myxococcales bacterium]|nr:zf-TFIIB domain-containing protein [Myxococcales bacterium]